MTDTEEPNCDVKNMPTWVVAVFAARESVSTLEEVVRAVVTACRDRRARVDVLINGNRGLAIELAQQFKSQPIVVRRNIVVCIWFLALGDKAQTWNTYIHRLHKGAELTFFVDGYTRPDPSAFHALAMALMANEHALAATGVPSRGRTADQHVKTMLREGGLQGGLFALSRKAMDEILQRKFRLPMGLYRVDSLIGAALNFNFDPATNRWDPSRIRVQPKATYYYQTLRWWRIKDIFAQMKRMQRQAQGALENLAIQNHLAHQRQLPETLPRTSQDLVLLWWRSSARPTWWQIFRHPSWLFALQKFKVKRDWAGAEKFPEIIFNSTNSTVENI